MHSEIVGTILIYLFIDTFMHTYIYTLTDLHRSIHTYIHTYIHMVLFLSGSLAEENEDESEEQVTDSDGFVYSVIKGSPNKKLTADEGPSDGKYIHAYILYAYNICMYSTWLHV